MAVCVLRIISNITTIFLNDEFSYKSSVSKYLSKMIHWWRAKAAIRPDEIGGPFRGSSFHIVCTMYSAKLQNIVASTQIKIPLFVPHGDIIL